MRINTLLWFQLSYNFESNIFCSLACLIFILIKLTLLEAVKHYELKSWSVRAYLKIKQTIELSMRILK